MTGWPKVAVMGGSLGGLTAALVLKDLGCHVDVYERSSSALEARGAGIGLHPMTVRYLSENAPLEEQRTTLQLPWLRFLDRAGCVAYEERKNYSFSSWNTIYRSLLACFDAAHYHLGREVAAFSQSRDRVSLQFTHGEDAQAQMLVCADGITSSARRVLSPGSERRYAGYVAWRGMVEEQRLSRPTYDALWDALTYCLLPHGHILIYPIPALDGSIEPGRRLANWVWYHNYAEGQELDALMTDRNGDRREISLPPGAVRPELEAWTRRFAQQHMAPPLAEVVDSTAQPFVQVIYDIEVGQMAFGRVALIGDGAFAVRPHAAAGTAKACADAWALRDALREAGGDVPAALADWEPDQLALGRALLARTRDMGDGSQFHSSWVPGDPSLRLGLYGPGR